MRDERNGVVGVRETDEMKERTSVVGRITVQR